MLTPSTTCESYCFAVRMKYSCTIAPINRMTTANINNRLFRRLLSMSRSEIQESLPTSCGTHCLLGFTMFSPTYLNSNLGSE